MARQFEQVAFEPSDIRIDLQHPAELHDDDWREVQDLRRIAFSSAFPHRDEEEINRFIPKNSPELYGKRVVDPTLAIPEGNSFANPLVARVFYSAGRNVVHESNAYVRAHTNDKPRGRLIGYVAMADNTSGPLKVIRQAKMKFDDKRYAWVSCVAIDPRFHGAGVGTEAMLNIFKSGHFRDHQPVSAYTLQDNIGGLTADSAMGRRFVQNVLGLSRRKDPETGTPLAAVPQHIFGDDKRPVQQVAWNVRTVAAVRDGLITRQNAKKRDNGYALGRKQNEV